MITLVRRLKVFLAWLIIIFTPLIFIVLLVTGVDLYLHNKYESSFGLNTKGYRGEILADKALNEFRIAAIGGSTTFGYGVNTKDSWPFFLEKNLNSSKQFPGRKNRYTVANLGYNNEGAFAYNFNLNAFEGLDFDAVIFFTGVNDLGEKNHTVFRNNPIFNAFGYFPILPIVLFEKAKIFETQGALEDAYLGENRSNSNFLKQKLSEFMLALLNIYNKLPDKEVLDYKDIELNQNYNSQIADDNCGNMWREYCKNLLVAITKAHKIGMKVFVFSEPSRGANVNSQKNAVKRLIEEVNSKGDKSIYWIDYTELLNLENKEISFDKMHLTTIGNRLLAKQMTLDLLPRVKD